ncbi:acid-sensing ion channel 4-like [Egretta garzetta]|uniref:acid-sensing ion channel 4-like n=1 Tax=Egretta garzetta TaxID=188379 RepID=UPI00051EE7E8|nr:acid-sensing ion channel 4-like [Egretta garzetta]
MQSFFHRLGHQIEDMLVECRFQGERCGPQHFAPVYTRYGKCYTFNGDRRNPRVTRQGGMGNGLEIMLDIQQEEYLPIWRETNETSFEAGIRVQIHSQDEPPYIHQLGFGVSPGFQTFVSCQEQRLRFPAVTLCNPNRARFLRLTKPDLYSVGQWLGLSQENRSLVPEMLAVLGEDRRTWLTRLANYSRFLPPRRSERTMQSFFHRLGHQIEDMLVECRFQGERCGPQHFAPVYTRYGKCYTFNGDRRNPRVTRQGGMGNGLEIMLDIQQEEYLPIWRETNETSFEAGIRVQIHSQDEPPYIHQLGFGVSPGFQTFVSCQEQRPRATLAPANLHPRATPALLPLGEQVEGGGQKWGQVPTPTTSCFSSGNESICSPNVYIECADHTLGKWENFLVLDIFFEALNYEAIEQKKAYDLAGLLGDIGGQMGLFIGASILTILEILDYVYEVIRDKVSRVLRRSKPPLKKPSGSIATLGLEELKDQEMRSQTLYRAHQAGHRILHPRGRPPRQGGLPLSEGCDLRRPIDTAKAEAAWVTVPMGSSSRYVNTAGSPPAPLMPSNPGGQDSPP